MTNEEIFYYVEDEGLGYSVQYGISGDDFEDKELKRLWGAARIAMDNLQAYLDIIEESIEFEQEENEE